MSYSGVNAFPKGILMIGRFMVLSILGILFRYYDIKQQGLKIPQNHLYNSALNIMYIICGLLLLSKKKNLIHAALVIIAAFLLNGIVKAITNPINGSGAAAVFVFSLSLHTFFFVYIWLKSKRYFAEIN
ncbi:MAG: hypothetical protein H7Y13_00335 [Sphingobacteriaceae bacterium]|nr:hypothetical protein [Sphingobacteriaceae bacterium]